MTSPTETVAYTDLPGLVHRGKVRDTYRVDDDLLLMIATDRISAYDIIMDNPIPGKGVLLSQMSAFWFRDIIGDIVPNHMVCMMDDADATAELPVVGALEHLPSSWHERSMLVRRAKRINIECVVRGYLAGAGWQEYSDHGTLNGDTLPKGIKPASKLSEPRFTPSTKAESGHDVPLTRGEAKELVGTELHRELERTSISLYERASQHAQRAGMILVDTKFECGFVDGVLTLIDEVLTPDSSRFWDAADWSPGEFPPAFDKQHLRQWLTDIGWDREPPPPAMPPHIAETTRSRYVAAYVRLTGSREMSLSST